MATEQVLRLVIQTIDTLQPADSFTFDRLSFANRIANVFEAALRSDQTEEAVALAIAVLTKLKTQL